MVFAFERGVNSHTTGYPPEMQWKALSSPRFGRTRHPPSDLSAAVLGKIGLGHRLSRGKSCLKSLWD
jgi:hypothetical protein